MNMKKQLILISIVAAICGCIADVLLLYSSEGNYHTGDLNFFNEISLNRITWGYFIGILLIPFELLGLGVVGDELYPPQSRKRKIFQFILEYLFILGLIYHGIISIMGIVKKEASNGDYVIGLCNALHDPLVFVLGIGFVLLTCGIVLPVWRKETSLPKWIVVFNPIVTYAVLLAIYFLFPVVGNYLMVAGFNFSILVFLLAALALMRECENA